MKVPMSWLQAMVNLPDGTTTEQVAQALTDHTATVEKVEVVGGELSGPIVIGHILSSIPEPQKNGKTINWCRVDVGPRYNAEGHPKNVEEGVEGRGIICGAPNAVEGAWVVVSLPGAVLPGGFAISARRTYGHMSDGMLCAADELGIRGGPRRRRHSRHWLLHVGAWHRPRGGPCHVRTLPGSLRRGTDQPG